jgi:hypothetical protein
MRLSDLAGVEPFELVRDAEFESVGLLSCDTPKLFASLYDTRVVRRELEGNTHVACIITSPKLAPLVPEHLGLAVAADPVASFYLDPA